VNLINHTSGHRVATRDVVGGIVVGANSGLVYVTHGAEARSEPPSVHWQDLPSPGAPFEVFNLLQWNCRLAPRLTGRDAPMAALRMWADTGPKLRLRFLVGPGGAGKTRLAAELADALDKSGWFAGFGALDEGTTLPLSQRGLLVILDYPEASPHAVRTMLRKAARLREPKAPIRLLLLSRRPLSDWHDDIVQTGATLICDEQEVDIGPLDEDAAVSVFRQVSTRLAEHRGLPARVMDDTAVSEWLRHCPEVHALPLLVTAGAIHFVDEPADRLGLGLPAGHIVEALVRRERKRLDLAASACGWGEHAGSQLVGLGVLRGWLDGPAVRRVATEIGLAEPARAVDVLRRLGWWADGRLRAPQPDIVAAELLRQVLHDAAERGPDWAWATLSAPEAMQAELIGRRMHDMAVLHGPAERSLTECLTRAVTDRPERAAAWQGLIQSENAGFRVSPLSIAVGRVLLADPTFSEERRGALLDWLSNDLANVGDSAGALAAIREALAIHRRLASANPARFEPDVAMSLNTLSLLLTDAGDSAGALVAIREASAIYRRLANANPARFEPDLAMCLNNLSNRLTDARDSAGALAAIREASAIYRRLVQANPARFEPDLARSLINLSNRLDDAGDGSGARAPIREALAIYRRLGNANPARFEPDVAISLHNLSIRFTNDGDSEGGLTAIREAAAIRRRLAQANPARFEPDFAMSLRNLSVQLTNAGDGEGALAAIREALAIYRRLAQANPERFEPDLEVSASWLLRLERGST
jgi:hypothetical protein